MDSSIDDTDADPEANAREVVVPLHLYKVVTVFSTMFAVAFVVGGVEDDEPADHERDREHGREDGHDLVEVERNHDLAGVGFRIGVGGFVVLDTATQRARLSLAEADVPLAILGVAMIAAGAVVYAFSTRFRAEGMGKPKDGSDERSNNG
jgi:hypothetical protein